MIVRNYFTNIAAIAFDAGGGLVTSAGGGWVLSRAPTMKKSVPKKICPYLVSTSVTRTKLTHSECTDK